MVTLTQLLIVHLLATEVLVPRVIRQLHCVDSVHIEAEDLMG